MLSAISRLALVQRADRGRHQHVGQHRHQHGDDGAECQHRPRQPPGREAGGLHHHQLAVRGQPIADIDGGGEGGDRQYQADHVGQGERGELEEHEGRLPVRQQLVEQRHRAVDPVDGNQHQREEAEQGHQLRQHVSVESRHAAPCPHLCRRLAAWPLRGRASRFGCSGIRLYPIRPAGQRANAGGAAEAGRRGRRRVRAGPGRADFAAGAGSRQERQPLSALSAVPAPPPPEPHPRPEQGPQPRRANARPLRRSSATSPPARVRTYDLAVP